MFQIQGFFFPIQFFDIKKIWRIYIPKLETLVEFTTLRKKRKKKKPKNSQKKIGFKQPQYLSGKNKFQILYYIQYRAFLLINRWWWWWCFFFL
jgi:hypothetical protein